MVPFVRYSLIALCLVLAAPLLAGFALASRSFLAVRSTGAALASAAFLISAALVLLVALRIFRFRDPEREADLAAGLLLAGVTSLACVAVAELSLARLRPALTYDRAVHLSPPIFRRSEILPIELVPGYDRPTYVWESDATVPLRINAQGFRGPAVAVPKPAGTYRILVLGDSFAINVAIPDESLYTILLEGMLGESADVHCRVEVVNAGWADGFSPDAYVAYMLNKGFALEPDLVIMQYFVLNDFKDLLENEVLESRDGRPLRVRSKYRYVDERGRLRRSTAWKYEIPVLRDSHLFVHLWDLLRLDRLNLRLVPILIPDYAGDNFLPNAYGIAAADAYADAQHRPAPLQEAFERSLEYVRQLDQEARGRGSAFLLFLVPDATQTSREAWQKAFASGPPGDWDAPNPQAQIHAALAPDGIAIFDPLAAYRERAEREALFLGASPDGHWNAAGNAFTAGILFEHLTRAFEPFGSDCVRAAPGASDPRGGAS